MRKIFLCLIFLFSVLTIPCFAYAEISVSLKLDRPQAGLTDSVQLVVSVAGSRDRESEPVIQGLENFAVSPGGTSSRIEFINGRMSSGTEYTYFIQPQKVGNYTIGPASVQIGGKTYTSNRSTLQVVRPAGDQGDDGSPIFLEAELSTPSIYVEEQAIYTLKLYLRKNVRDIRLDMPENENLSFKQLAKPAEYRSSRKRQGIQRAGSPLRRCAVQTGCLCGRTGQDEHDRFGTAQPIRPRFFGQPVF